MAGKVLIVFLGLQVLVSIVSGDSSKQYFVKTDWYKDLRWCRHSGARLMTGDFNGDGRADMFCHDDKGRVWVALANAAGHFTGTSWEKPMKWCRRSNEELHLGDFNGDGRTDMLCHQNGTGLIWVSLANVGGSFPDDSWHDKNLKLCSHNGSRVLVGDFNGDGRSDIFCYDSKNKWVTLARPGGTFRQDITSHQVSNWCSHAGSSFSVADFNGDLRDDFHCHDNTGKNWVMLSGPDGKFTGRTDWHPSSKWCTDEFHLAYLNGDKRADMLCHRKKDGLMQIAAAGPQVKSLYKGTSWQKTMDWCGVNRRLLVGDFNNDGKDDLLCHEQSTGKKWISYNRYPSKARYTCSKAKPVQDIDAKVPGVIVSSGYPNDYSDNEDCTWKLEVPLGSVVRVTIKNLKLDPKDYLTISDGETAFGGNLIAKYSGCMTGVISLFSTGTFMHIQFTSDGSKTAKGFELEFKAVRKSKIITDGQVSTICSFQTSVAQKSGYVAHPGFPSGVERPQRCQWRVATPNSGKRIAISYQMMGLHPKNFGFCDNDMVRHRAPGKRPFDDCGCEKLPSNYESDEDNLFVAFIASEGSRQPGFLVHYHELDKGQCPDINNCQPLKDERFVGFDRRGNVLYEKKEVTTTVGTTTTPTEKPMGPFEVECHRDEMKVALNFTNWPLLVQKTAQLLDPNCKAYHEDATHVYIKTPLDKCGTYHNYSSDGRYIIYYNEFLIEKVGAFKPGDIITRDHLAAFKFECRYHRKAVLSVIHFTPARASVYTSTENFGNFTYMMQLFKTKEYKEAHDEYPVQVLANKKLYIQTEVQANDSELILLVEHCKVTPSNDYNDKEYYVIIEEGCERDDTLKYKHKIASKQRFDFNAFYFEKDKDASIHIHCKVRVCRKLDKNSRCMKGCPYSKRRRRAVDANEETEITGRLSIGPIDVQKESQTGRLRGSDSPKMFIVEILVGVLGFIVFALLIAVSIVLWKRRQERNKSILTLIIEDNEQ